MFIDLDNFKEVNDRYGHKVGDAQPDSDLSLTLSIGVASARPEMEEVAAGLKAADDALYEAKRRGKNQIYAH